MKYEATFVLHANEEVNYTEETVEKLIDALHEVDALLEIDVCGSLASRDLTVDVVVEAESLDSAQACVTSSMRWAVMHAGGQIVSDASPPLRGTRMHTRELAQA